MTIFNKRDGYGLVSIFIHWFLFLLIVGVIVSGKYADHPELENIQLFAIHQQIGLAVLILVLLSILWRFLNTHVQSEGLAFLRALNFLVQWTLYLSILAQGLLGICMNQLSGIKVSLFVWEFPINLSKNIYPLLTNLDSLLSTPISEENIETALNELHGIGAWSIISLIVCHFVLIFLQLLTSDSDIIKRMWFNYTSPYSHKE